ncbi:TnpV protein [Ruminococcus sp. JE7B6]|uniref:TnpV protein n=1 Tax=Ruminococcus sp. JE7B6 TaxID=3233380 RepID=UPI0038997ED4
MKQKTIFEQLGGTYSRQGDYLLPNLTVPDQDDYEIGIWGQRRRRYLKEHHRILYYNLLTSCKLRPHLAEVEKECNERMDTLVKAIAKQEGVTEALKAADQMAWVRRMSVT